MANENTARRNVYLPRELDEWFVKEFGKTDIKVNTLILEALNEYVDKRSKSGKKQKIDFDKNVRRIALELLEEKGLV